MSSTPSLQELFHAAVTDDPALRLDIPAVIRAGRQARRRRGVLASAAVTAVIVAAITGTLVLAPTHGKVAQTLTGRPTATAPPVVQTPTGRPTATAPADGLPSPLPSSYARHQDAQSKRIRDAIYARLDPGRTHLVLPGLGGAGTEVRGHTTYSDRGALGAWVQGGREGTVAVYVWRGRNPALDKQPIHFGPNRPVRVGNRDCQVTVPAEGGVRQRVVVWTGCEVRSGRDRNQIHVVHGMDGSRPVLSVSDLRRDGSIVSMAVNAKPYEHMFSGLINYMKQELPGFDVLPLTVDQLIAVTTDPRLSL